MSAWWQYFYVQGVHFTQPDHRCLTYLHHVRDINGRLTRWFLFLQPYDFATEHMLGNENADGLSRQAWEDTIIRAQENEGRVSEKLP